MCLIILILGMILHYNFMVFGGFNMYNEYGKIEMKRIYSQRFFSCIICVIIIVTLGFMSAKLAFRFISEKLYFNNFIPILMSLIMIIIIISIFRYLHFFIICDFYMDSTKKNISVKTLMKTYKIKNIVEIKRGFLRNNLSFKCKLENNKTKTFTAQAYSYRNTLGHELLDYDFIKKIPADSHNYKI